MEFFQNAFILVCLFLKLLGSINSGRFKPKALDAIYEKLKEYTREHPHFASMQEIGRSYEGRPIYCVKIHDSTKASVASVIIDFGIHGREWAGPSSALYMVNEFLIQHEFRDIIQLVTWYIIPVVNPDGYHYSITKQRAWRKNRRPLPNSTCIGVDLNRNYPIGWDQKLSKRDMWCHHDYSGPQPLSEPETKALGRFFEKIGSVDAYVTVHSCAQSILYPFSSKGINLPQEKLQELLKVALKMKSAVENVNGNEYVVQQSADFDGVAGGASDDYVFVNFSIPIVLTLELGFDSPSVERCFFPNEQGTEILNHECLAAIRSLGQYLIDQNVIEKPPGVISKERKLMVNSGNRITLQLSNFCTYLIRTLGAFRNSIFSFLTNISIKNT